MSRGGEPQGETEEMFKPEKPDEKSPLDAPCDSELDPFLVKDVCETASPVRTGPREGLEAVCRREGPDFDGCFLVVSKNALFVRKS